MAKRLAADNGRQQSRKEISRVREVWVGVQRSEYVIFLEMI